MPKQQQDASNQPLYVSLTRSKSNGKKCFMFHWQKEYALQRDMADFRALHCYPAEGRVMKEALIEFFDKHLRGG